jgi:hypothetical protein
MHIQEDDAKNQLSRSLNINTSWSQLCLSSSSSSATYTSAGSMSFVNLWMSFIFSEVERLSLRVCKSMIAQVLSDIESAWQGLEGLEPRLIFCSMISVRQLRVPCVTVRTRVYRGVTWRTFHFSYTFHSYVLFILFHTSFRIQTPSTCPFHSTMSMLPFYSVHTQVYETCFTDLLFHLYLF